MNGETRAQQIEAWCSLILSYTRHHRLDSLTVDEALTTPLFSNTDLNRKRHRPTTQLTVAGSVDKTFALILLEELAKRGTSFAEPTRLTWIGNVEWLGGGKEQCLIMWRSPREWATIINQWVR